MYIRVGFYSSEGNVSMIFLTWIFVTQKIEPERVSFTPEILKIIRESESCSMTEIFFIFYTLESPPLWISYDTD